MNIGTIVLATSDDIQFLYTLIDQSLIFSSQVVISFGSHFYNNEPENEDVITELEQKYENRVSVVRYNIREDSVLDSSVSPDNYWHCHGRWIAINKLKPDIEYVFLLYADEIPDGEDILNWLKMTPYKTYDCVKFANYLYHREAICRSKRIEDSIVFIKKEHLDTPYLTMQTLERTATYDLCPGNKRRRVLSHSTSKHPWSPMFHHYSWVRTYKQMLRKVRSWGHKRDLDWESLVDDEFKNRTHKMFGPYEIVDNIFNISLKDN